MAQQSEHIPVSKLLSLEGKVAIVTGGGMGIGRGIVRRLAEAGAAVVVMDRDESAAARTVEEVRQSGATAMALVGDVAEESSVRQVVQASVGEYGHLDVLVNNAGIYPFRPALEMSVQEWDRVQNVNLRGAFLYSREFANQVIAQGGGGVIVNIGSIDSFHPSSVGLAAYDASKGGLLMFTRNFALEVAPYRIRVNMIAPGAIATEGSQQSLAGLSPEQAEAIRAQFIARIPLRRMGTPDNIATVTLFLSSPASAYMTGAAVIVDGGILLT